LIFLGNDIRRDTLMVCDPEATPYKYLASIKIKATAATIRNPKSPVRNPDRGGALDCMTSYERTPEQVGLKPLCTRDHLRLLDDDDVVHLLRAAVKREGSQAAFAKRYGLDRFTLNSVLNGKRRVNATVLKAFGLRKVYVIDDYEVLSGGVSNLSHDASGR
jgi:hypothetical protein